MNFSLYCKVYSNFLAPYAHRTYFLATFLIHIVNMWKYDCLNIVAPRYNLLFHLLRWQRILCIVNTHMHADHITGTGHLKQLLPNVKSVISARSGARADKHLADGDCLQFGRHQITAIATPGHTSGCMSFVNHEQVSWMDLGEWEVRQRERETL